MTRLPSPFQLYAFGSLRTAAAAVLIFAIFVLVGLGYFLSGLAENLGLNHDSLTADHRDVLRDISRIKEMLIAVCELYGYQSIFEKALDCDGINRFLAENLDKLQKGLNTLRVQHTLRGPRIVDPWGTPYIILPVTSKDFWFPTSVGDIRSCWLLIPTYTRRPKDRVLFVIFSCGPNSRFDGMSGDDMFRHFDKVFYRYHWALLKSDLYDRSSK